MVYRLVLALAIIVVLSACATGNGTRADGKADTSDPGKALAVTLPGLLESTGVPSVSVAHIEGRQIVALQAAGERSRGEAATTATRYNVASLTKPITAEVVLRLISAGAFTLDESMASNWIDPDIADDPRHRLLTPRLSLSHQTGFPNWRDRAKGLAFERDPSTAPGYSGEGYEYVARFVKERTGADLEAHARRLVFEPLGMADTAYTMPPDLIGELAASRDADGNWIEPSFRQKAMASDDLFTTAEDYASFLAALMGDQGLSVDMLTEQRKVQADRQVDTCKSLPVNICPDEAGFALGWELFVLNGKRYFTHTGSDEDAFAFAYWNRATQTGTVILTNSRQGSHLVLPILELLRADPEYVSLLRAMSEQ